MTLERDGSVSEQPLPSFDPHIVHGPTWRLLCSSFLVMAYFLGVII